MLVHQAYRFELDPNNEVRSQFASHCGAARVAFNWGHDLVKDQLAQRDRVREAALRELLTDVEVGELVRNVELTWSKYSLYKEWNKQKATVAPWWAENSKFAYESGITAFADALSNFSKSKTGLRKGSMGFPRRKKHGARRSCRFWADVRVVDERHVRIPRIGIVRSKEMTTALKRRLDEGSARILYATLSEEAGRWFCSFTCEVERNDAPAKRKGSIVGVDLGVVSLAVFSEGEPVANPRCLNHYARKMARLSRELARRTKGSKRRAVTRSKLARTHRQIRCARRDALHQVTSVLAATYETVVIEDLTVKNMTATPKPKPDPKRPGAFSPNGRRRKAGLNRALLDVAPGEFRRQLTYKLAWHCGTLVVADRFYPSSKTCSSCGAVRAKLSPRTRTFRCGCGLVIDRDRNAAYNLASLVTDVAGGRSETENGRGGDDGPSRAVPSETSRRPRSSRKTVLVGSVPN